MRTLLPKDLFRFEQVQTVELSPDGNWLAYEWVRAGDSGKVKSVTIFKQTRTDIWIVSTRGGEPRPITSGAESGTGFFHPMWAPDGERLAMLSIKEEDIRLWIWEKATGSLFQVSNLGVDCFLSPSLCEWITSEQMACMMWPQGSLERGRLQAEETRPGSYAAQHWSRSWSGETVTADVLDSGTQPPRDAKSLVVVDVPSRKTEIIAEVNWGYVKLSPDRRYVATFRPEDMLGDHVRYRLSSKQFSSLMYGLGNVMQVFDLHKREFAHQAVVINEPKHRSLQWSPTRNEFALFGSTSRLTDNEKGCVHRYDLEAGSLTEIASVSLRIDEIKWSGDGDLLVLAEPTRSEEGNGRPDWWRIRDSRNWDLLTKRIESIPLRLLSARGSGLICLSDGDLWSIDPASQEVKNLTESLKPRITGITWSMEDVYPDHDVAHYIVTTEEAEKDHLVLIKVGSEGIVETISVLMPSEEAKLKAYSPFSEIAIFQADDSTGTHVWATSKCNDVLDKANQVVETNMWLRKVKAGEVRHLQYRHLDGEKMTAWVILPPDHIENQRHPTIVSVYAGTVYHDRRPSTTHINYPHSIANLQLLAAHGYAVLLPSMPLPSEDGLVKGDPYLELSKGVLPAVDQLIEI